MKKIFYFIVLAVLTLISSVKLGFFDCSRVQIDNFIFDKPTLYRLIYNGDVQNCKYGFAGIKKIHLNSNSLDSRSFVFMGIFDNNAATYTITKEPRLKFFNAFLKLLKKEKGFQRSNRSSCKVFTNSNYGMSKDEDMTVGIISVAAYPYIVSFTETSKNREVNTINMICGSDGSD